MVKGLLVVFSLSACVFNFLALAVEHWLMLFMALGDQPALVETCRGDLWGWSCARPSRCGYVRKLVNNKTLECAFIDGLVVVSPADRLYLPSGDHLRQNQLTFDFMFAFRQRIFVSKVQVKKVAFPDFPPDELPGGPPDKFTSAPLCEELGNFYLGGFFE